MILQKSTNANSKGPNFCELEVRADGSIASAGDWFYKFIGNNSMIPFYELVSEDDKEAIQNDIVFFTSHDEEDFHEYATSIQNFAGLTTGNVHVTLRRSLLTDNGEPLCNVTIIDINTQVAYAQNYPNIIAKYRYFMTLKNEIYFDYDFKTDFLSVYKYVNERSITIYKGPMDGYLDEQLKSYATTFIGVAPIIEEIRTTLKGHAKNYDRTITLTDRESGADVTCRIMGGIPLFHTDSFYGIFVPNPVTDHLPYYLTPAGRDPGTGLFNKRAVTEYAIDMINASPKNGWLLVIDIDDFKAINDTQGHLYGDDVIKAVAETISTTIGIMGITGRYGGDEFVVFIDEDLSRDELKALLKVITKKLSIRFDPLVHVTLSIGICQYPDHATNFEDLFIKADQCLYIAKDKGKNRHIIYDPELHDKIIAENASTKSLSYIANKGLRRDFLIEIVGELCQKGLDALAPETGNLRMLRELFDVDGVLGFKIGEETPRFSAGQYVGDFHDAIGALNIAEPGPIMQNTTKPFLVNVVNDAEKIKELDRNNYDLLKAHEVAASIQCIGIKDHKPYCMVTYDVFNRKRKWSDTDIDALTMIGSCIISIMLSL